MPDNGRLTKPHAKRCYLTCLVGIQRQGLGSSAKQGEYEMLKIQKDTGGCVAKLRLSGRIQSDQIVNIRSEMDGNCASKILDLSEVTLVDLGVVRFLIGCEDEGVELVQCPLYVREWMLRERAEGAELGSSDAR